MALFVPILAGVGLTSLAGGFSTMASWFGFKKASPLPEVPQPATPQLFTWSNLIKVGVVLGLVSASLTVGAKLMRFIRRK
ncbi:MAG: hypothetical protein OXR68_00090 [Alphaproteobacteria bacterium]|nr:hypothetical protein [Alphaproteobacteria bacterium]MDD9919010.1 hypothetical protein [Alphaproteobacteria bacterium]